MVVVLFVAGHSCSTGTFPRLLVIIVLRSTPVVQARSLTRLFLAFVLSRSTPVVQARSLARIGVAGDTGLSVCC
jgi:hypothetical protein